MALAQSVIDIVAEEARRAQCARVRKVRLAIGVLSHVDPEALRFGFEVASARSPAAGAALEIEALPARGYCVACSSEVEVEARGAPCPRCGGFQWLLTQGDEMRVTELEVD